VGLFIGDLISGRGVGADFMRGEIKRQILSFQGSVRRDGQQDLQALFGEVKGVIEDSIVEPVGGELTREHEAFLQRALLIVDRSLKWLNREDPGQLPQLPQARPNTWSETLSIFANHNNSRIDNPYLPSGDANQAGNGPQFQNFSS